jgi:hypothetical protein
MGIFRNKYDYDEKTRRSGVFFEAALRITSWLLQQQLLQQQRGQLVPMR